MRGQEGQSEEQLNPNLALVVVDNQRRKKEEEEEEESPGGAVVMEKEHLGRKAGGGGEESCGMAAASPQMREERQEEEREIVSQQQQQEEEGERTNQMEEAEAEERISMDMEELGLPMDDLRMESPTQPLHVLASPPPHLEETELVEAGGPDSPLEEDIVGNLIDEAGCLALMSSPANRELINRLMRVVCYITVVWTIIVWLDTIQLIRAIQGRKSPISLLFFRYFMFR